MSAITAEYLFYPSARRAPWARCWAFNRRAAAMRCWPMCRTLPDDLEAANQRRVLGHMPYGSVGYFTGAGPSRDRLTPPPKRAVGFLCADYGALMSEHVPAARRQDRPIPCSALKSRLAVLGDQMTFSIRKHTYAARGYTYHSLRPARSATAKGAQSLSGQYGQAFQPSDGNKLWRPFDGIHKAAAGSGSAEREQWF